MPAETEVLPSGAFETLAGVHGDRWRAFARTRLVPVAGDVSLPGLGLEEHDHAALASRVDIIINAAASVAFDEPLDSALLHNVRSVEHVAAFAQACRAAALVHVSTAFVAGRRTERFAEGPLAPDVSSSEVDASARLTTAIVISSNAAAIADPTSTWVTMPSHISAISSVGCDVMTSDPNDRPFAAMGTVTVVCSG